MAALVIKNVAAVPTGATYTEITGITFSGGATLTKIAGVFDTTPGEYLYKVANGLNGGVPNQGDFSATLFSATTSIVPAGATYTEFTGLTFSAGPALTKIAGVFDTTLGAYRVTKIIRGLLGNAIPPPPTFGSIMVFVCC